MEVVDRFGQAVVVTNLDELCAPAVRQDRATSSIAQLLTLLEQLAELKSVRVDVTTVEVAVVLVIAIDLRSRIDELESGPGPFALMGRT